MEKFLTYPCQVAKHTEIYIAKQITKRARPAKNRKITAKRHLKGRSSEARIYLGPVDRRFELLRDGRGNCDFDDNFAQASISLPSLSFLSLTINFEGFTVYIHKAECAGLPRDLVGGEITRGVTSNFIATRGIMRPASSRED